MALTAVPVKLVLASQARLAERLVREALADGGRLLAPIAPPNGDPASFMPTVIVDASPDSALCREASFAPIMAVIPFDALDDVLDRNDRCPYGLGASVFTRDVHRAEALAALLPAGMVTINDVIVPTAHPATPFGGVGDSGWGVTQGAEGLLEMTTAQVVSRRGGAFRPHYDLAAGKSAEKQGDLLRGVLESGACSRRSAGAGAAGGCCWRRCARGVSRLAATRRGALGRSASLRVAAKRSRRIGDNARRRQLRRRSSPRR